jgi:tRNA threonylcarbamoyladenosine modification (KEOPS) complex  Pcc1 subunit
LEKYKANICIFFHDKIDFNNICLENGSAKNPIDVKELLNAAYIALKGDLGSSPGFGTAVNISMLDSYIVVNMTSDDLSKFRASVSSLLRLIDLIYRTLLY